MVIRLYLFLSGYPQAGGGGLHIARMIWAPCYCSRRSCFPFRGFARVSLDRGGVRLEGWRERTWFYRLLALSVLAGAVITAVEIAVILMIRHSGWRDGPVAVASGAVHAQIGLSVVSVLELVVALLSLALAALGVANTADDARGLRYSELSLFIGVAFLQPLASYEAQFFAFAGMVLGIGAIVIVQYASERAQPAPWGVKGSHGRSSPAKRPSRAAPPRRQSSATRSRS